MTEALAQRLAAAVHTFGRKGYDAILPSIRGSTNEEEARLRLERAIEVEYAIVKLIELTITEDGVDSIFESDTGADAQQFCWIRSIYYEALQTFDPIHRSILHPQQEVVIANTQRILKSPETLASLLEPFDLAILKPKGDWDTDLIPRYVRAFIRFREYARLVAGCKSGIFAALAMLHPNPSEAPPFFASSMLEALKVTIYLRVDPSAGEPLRIIATNDAVDVPELHPGYLRINAPTICNAREKVLVTGFMVVPPFMPADYAPLFTLLADGLAWLAKSPTLNHRPNPFQGMRMDRPYQVMTPWPNV